MRGTVAVADREGPTIIAAVEGEHFELLRQVFISTITDAATRMGKTPPARDTVDVVITSRPEDGWLWIVIAAFGGETSIEWDGTLADAIKDVVDTAVTRAFDFDM